MTHVKVVAERRCAGIKLKLESRSVVAVIGGKTPESNLLLFHLDFQFLLSIWMQILICYT
jgi:hypothetical protein